MRSDAALSKLTEEQQADLFDWLTTDTYDVVLKRIAQPPPDGFGIKTHINSLYRFYEQRQAAIRAHDLAIVCGTHPSSGSPLPQGEESEVREVSQRAASDPHWEGESPLEPNNLPLSSGSHCENGNRFYEAAKSAFSHSTYVLANSPLTGATYRAVSRTLHQHEDISVKREYLDVARQQLALARERLQFDRAQFEYNAARAALAILPELIAIDQMTDIDDEAKIWRVRDRLFGAPPPQDPGLRPRFADANAPNGELNRGVGNATQDSQPRTHN
jgi:hypothetical protein